MLQLGKLLKNTSYIKISKTEPKNDFLHKYLLFLTTTTKSLIQRVNNKQINFKNFILDVFEPIIKNLKSINNDQILGNTVY